MGFRGIVDRGLPFRGCFGSSGWSCGFSSSGGTSFFFGRQRIERYRYSIIDISIRSLASHWSNIGLINASSGVIFFSPVIQ
mmetsp:Transcript_35907/g.56143  ORF Transcript_35907/g.56143 Transcript_35907/m.56143 type:complete len:81 (+) Transcript_35907:192-434(+)